jgi:transketolase-like protein
LCLEAYEELKSEGIHARVVSLPSWELFDEQPQDYRDTVLPPDVTARVSVEQASTFGWAKYVGATGHSIGMRSFGFIRAAEGLGKEVRFHLGARGGCRQRINCARPQVTTNRKCLVSGHNFATYQIVCIAVSIASG